MSKPKQAPANAGPKKLYYSVGTVVFQCNEWSVVLDRERNLHWIDNKRNLVPEKHLGRVVWLIYSREHMAFRAETIIPFEQAVEEDLSKDFEAGK